MIAALFLLENSVYKEYDNVDCYDLERNALNFKGDYPVICHPPCRLFSRLRKSSTAPLEEKELAYHSIDLVRKNGGVLEHPSSSILWKEKKLPLGKERDKYGGFTLSVDQSWFGHKAQKRTWLYICGIEPKEIPSYTPNFIPFTHYCGYDKKGIYRELSKNERKATPRLFAEFLMKIAIKVKKNSKNE